MSARDLRLTNRRAFRERRDLIVKLLTEHLQKHGPTLRRTLLKEVTETLWMWLHEHVTSARTRSKEDLRLHVFDILNDAVKSEKFVKSGEGVNIIFSLPESK